MTQHNLKNAHKMLARFNRLLRCSNCTIHGELIQIGYSRFNNVNQQYSSDSKSDEVLGSAASKYKIFRDQDAEVILDSNEELYKYPSIIQHQSDWSQKDEFEGINLQHGVYGVFDIHDLVDVLKRENAQDLLVCKVPSELKYVDYITVVSGKSTRHMVALAEFVRKTFKQKRHPTEILPKVEGRFSKEWLALDLGNIALHIFSSNARKQYDIDTLWAVGSEYDSECNKPKDSITELLERHTIYLHDLHPKTN